MTKEYEPDVMVNRDALLELLRAVNAANTRHSYIIHEMVALRENPMTGGPDLKNPINIVMADIERNQKPKRCCDTGHVSNGWHHDPSCKNWRVVD